MKLLFPAALGLVLASCASIMPEPKPGTVDHQQWLHNQAREHFQAMKEEERRSRLAAGLPVSGQKPAPTQGTAPLAKRPATTPTPAPHYALFRAKRPQPAPTDAQRLRRNDDTLYIWDMPKRSREGTTQTFTKAEIRYAKELAKSPENLTSEERLWALRHYR